MATSWSSAFSAAFGGTLTVSPAQLRSGVEVWTDVEAAGGTRESVFVVPLAVRDRDEIPDNGHVSPRDSLTVEVSADAAAMDDVTQGKVLRVDLADGEVGEWRVWKHTTDRDTSGALRATIECRSIAWDLFTRTPLLEITEAGMKDTDFAFKGLTPAEWIDDLILVTTDWPSWIVKGTVDATTRHSLNVDWTHAGPLLDKLAELTAHEWTLRRNGATDYRIDILAERGSSAARPIIAANLNLLSAAKESTAENQATRVYPQGGGAAGFRANMGEARWNVDSVSGSTVTLSDPAGGDGPVGFDDQLGGFSDTTVIPNRYLEKTDGTTTEITDSDASADTVTVADATGISANDLVAIRANAAGDELIFLEHPTAKNTHGLYATTLERADVPDIQNLLSDVADAYLDTDTDADGLADGWNEIGTPTTTMDTDAANHKHGTGSQKVVASVDEGIESDPITVDPTTTRPYFAAEGRVKAESGTVQIHIVDASNNDRLHPKSEVNSGRTPNLNTIEPITSAPGVNFDDLSTTQIKVRFVARGGSSTFWVDGASLVQQQVPVGRVVEGRGANVLWQAANDELADRSLPEDRWDIDPIDLYRADTSRWPDQQIDVGQTVIVKDTGLDTDAELRVVARERDLLTPGRVQVTVDHRPKTLAERINRNQIDQLFDDQPASSGANRTEGNRPNVLNSGTGQVAPSAASGLHLLASINSATYSPGSISPAVGDLDVSPIRVSNTVEIQNLSIEDQGGGAGVVRVAIYSDDGNYPDTLLYESGDLTLDTTSNTITVSGPIIEMEKDQTYWVGIQCTSNSSGTASYGSMGPEAVASLGHLASFNSGGRSRLQSTGNGSVVPDVFPSSATAAGGVPWVPLEAP